MKRQFIAIAASGAATVALASSCPTGEALLKNNTPLSSLCPNGFGQFSPGGIQNAMQNQSNNVAMITAAAQNYGVPTDLALAVSYHESEGFNSCAGSDTGVKGPMQLTQSTGSSLGFNRDINEQNINGGMALLAKAANSCGATNYSCLAAKYNGSNRPGEQAGWAAGVAKADQQLKNNPSLMAAACPGSGCNPNTGNAPAAPAGPLTTPSSPTLVG